MYFTSSWLLCKFRSYRSEHSLLVTYISTFYMDLGLENLLAKPQSPSNRLAAKKMQVQLCLKELPFLCYVV